MFLKNKFPDVFSEHLGKCSKIKAIFELKPKDSAPFAALESINKELDRLVNLGVISSVDSSEWSALTVYMQKKKKNVRIEIFEKNVKQIF